MDDQMQSDYYDEYEIDLREYIMLLWKNKLLIIGFVLLAIVAAFLYSTFLVAPVYEAKSTLLILAPRYTTSLEVETFSIDTYRNLATTDSIKQKVIEDLDLRNEKGERYNIGQLANMMDIEILASEKSGEANNNGDAPLIELRVKNNDPKLAANIANAWAKNFMNDSKEIRKNEVIEVATIIQEQFADTEEKLNKLRSDLLAFNKENRLGLLRKRLNNKANKLHIMNKNVVDLESQLGLKESQFKNINTEISKMEKNDIWTGELSNLNSPNDQSVEFKKNYLDKKKELLNFKEKNNIYLLQQKINTEKEKLSDYTSRKKELKLMLEKENDNKIIKFKNSLAEKKAEMIFLKDEIKNLEAEGYYLGALEFDNNKDTTNLSYKNNYIEAQNKLLEFQKDHNLNILKSDLNKKRNIAQNYRDKINRMKDQLKDNNIRNDKINTLLKRENNYWDLKKSLNETPLWNNLLEAEDVKILSEIELNNQIINPVYKKLKLYSTKNDVILETYPEQIKYYEKKLVNVESDIKNLNANINFLDNEKNNLTTDLNTYKNIYVNENNRYINFKKQLNKKESEINSLKSKINYFKEYELDNINKLILKYNNLTKKKENKIKELETRLANWRNDLNYLKSDISNYKDIYNQVTNEYKNLVKNRLKVKLDIEELKSKLNYYKNAEEELNTEIKKMQNELWEGENKKDILKQKTKDVQNTYNSLASRVEEARITEAQRSSDVRFYSEAVEPSNPVSNNKKLNIAIAAVLALMLSVFIVFFKEFMKEE